MLNLVPNFVRSSIRPFYGAASLLLSSNHRWVNGELSRRARRLRPRVRHPSYASAQARSIYQTARSKSHRLAIEGDEKMAARFGLERVTPFLDRDVIASVMRDPDPARRSSGAAARCLPGDRTAADP
jgi:asparagine synthetase B (glutamine-hydrolysing)